MLNILLTAAIGQAGFNLVYPVDIAEHTTLQLGDVLNTADSVCQISSAGRTGSGCLTSDANVAQFNISAVGQSHINVVVHNVVTDHFTFEPNLQDGAQQQLFDIQSGQLTLIVGGKLTVIKPAENGSYTVNYTVEINYE
ncbi:DUF4402 domain-containing protein [Shewanella sp. Scap07]|uniref:DUF4402 domain-containing protein n=1 Tax=Shewanella sp. Scap07 TaxID=2589987 RepID=UPI0015C0A584|nr:DUF4402 domain-containing protein [Shewanella sp. Scap07]